MFSYNFVGGVTATVAGSTITDNQAIGGTGRTGIAGGNGLGGGIAIGGLGSPYPGRGSVDISDTTIARNLAQGGDGGKGADGGDGLGGGLYNDGSSNLVLTTSTVTTQPRPREFRRGAPEEAAGPTLPPGNLPNPPPAADSCRKRALFL